MMPIVRKQARDNMKLANTPRVTDAVALSDSNQRPDGRRIEHHDAQLQSNRYGEHTRTAHKPSVCAGKEVERRSRSGTFAERVG